MSRMPTSGVTLPDVKKGEYHMFLAHSSDDTTLSTEIRDRLEKIGVRCFNSDVDFEVDTFYVKLMYHNVRLK